MTFRFSNLNRLKQVSVSIPRDENGFLGRECPEADCEGYFKIKPGTGLTGENLSCTCPYCGHSGSQNSFYTKEQIAYGQSVAKRQVVEALRKDLKSLEFSTKPSGMLGISMSLKLQPGTLPGLRHYREQSLETHVRCDNCTLDFAVYGVFGYCPDCSVHNSLQILKKNLSLAVKQVELAETIDDQDLARNLIEDALENCVSEFDGFGREACLIRSAKSSNQKACEKLSFQNLQRAAVSLNSLFGFDLATAINTDEWKFAHLCFMRRHLLAHRSGVIDQKFLDEVGEENGIVGRRVTITVEEVRKLSRILEGIGLQLIRFLPAPL